MSPPVMAPSASAAAALTPWGYPVARPSAAKGGKQRLAAQRSVSTFDEIVATSEPPPRNTVLKQEEEEIVATSELKPIEQPRPPSEAEAAAPDPTEIQRIIERGRVNLDYATGELTMRSTWRYKKRRWAKSSGACDEPTAELDRTCGDVRAEVQDAAEVIVLFKVPTSIVCYCSDVHPQSDAHAKWLKELYLNRVRLLRRLLLESGVPESLLTMGVESGTFKMHSEGTFKRWSHHEVTESQGITMRLDLTRSAGRSVPHEDEEPVASSEGDPPDFIDWVATRWDRLKTYFMESDIAVGGKQQPFRLTAAGWAEAVRSLGFKGDANAVFEEIASEKGDTTARPPDSTGTATITLAQFRRFEKRVVEQSVSSSAAQLVDVLQKRYNGSVLRAWMLEMDQRGVGRLVYKDFADACSRLGIAKQSRGMWEKLSPDGCALEFADVAPAEAQHVERFVSALAAVTGNRFSDAWDVMDVQHQNWLTIEDFTKGSKKLNFDGDVRMLFRGLEDLGRIHREEFCYLEKLSQKKRQPQQRPTSANGRSSRQVRDRQAQPQSSSRPSSCSAPFRRVEHPADWNNSLHDVSTLNALKAKGIRTYFHRPSLDRAPKANGFKPPQRTRAQADAPEKSGLRASRSQPNLKAKPAWDDRKLLCDPNLPACSRTYFSDTTERPVLELMRANNYHSRY